MENRKCSTEKIIECLLQTLSQKIKRNLDYQKCIDVCKQEIASIWMRDMDQIENYCLSIGEKS